MPVPAELVAAVVRPVLVAVLRCGIRSVVDARSSGLDGLVVAATDVGIRAAIGPSLADMWHDEHGVLDRRAELDALFAGARDWISAHDNAGDGRMRAVVSMVEIDFGTASDRSIPALLATSVPIVLGSDYAPNMIAPRVRSDRRPHHISSLMSPLTGQRSLRPTSGGIR